MDKVVTQYERDFAEWLGVRHARTFWKGRVALYALLRALGVGRGDEVILPGYTCVMDVNPIKYLGAKPVYVDIEPHTFNMSPPSVADAITAYTKAIIVQHTYGYPCEMDALMEIAHSAGIPLIEDCCLAVGSKYEGKSVGTFGCAAYFSSQWNKPYTTGLGGMLTTNDSDLAAAVDALENDEMCAPSAKDVFMLWSQLLAYRILVYPRTTAFVQNVFRYLTKKGAVVGSSSTCEFEPVMQTDFFKAMSSVQARAGIRQLERIESNIAHRKRMAQLYDEHLEAKGWVPRQYDDDRIDPVMVRYPVRIEEKDKALSAAANAGIELGSWFESPLHPIETPLASYDYENGVCPESERAARQVVNLPLHPRATRKTIARTVEFISRFTQAQ